MSQVQELNSARVSEVIPEKGPDLSPDATKVAAHCEFPFRD